MLFRSNDETLQLSLENLAFALGAQEESLRLIHVRPAPSDFTGVSLTGFGKLTSLRIDLHNMQDVPFHLSTHVITPSLRTLSLGYDWSLVHSEVIPAFNDRQVQTLSNVLELVQVHKPGLQIIKIFFDPGGPRYGCFCHPKVNHDRGTPWDFILAMQ